MLKKSASILKVKVEAKVERLQIPPKRNRDRSLFVVARYGRACRKARLGALGLGGANQTRQPVTELEVEVSRLKRELAEARTERAIVKRPRQVQPVSATRQGFIYDWEECGMARLGRPGMTTAQKAEIWRRWRNGGSLSDIGRVVGKFPASIFGLLRLHGGITPSARHRAVRALTLAELEEISRGLAAGSSLRQIARTLNRAPSTISREVSRTPIDRGIVRTGRKRPPGAAPVGPNSVGSRGMAD